MDRLAGLTKWGRLAIFEVHDVARIISEISAEKRGEISRLVKSVHVHNSKKPGKMNTGR